MKHQRTSIILAVALIASPAMASISMDYVTVGNAGNAADSTGYGAVNYTYNIGKYEVTNAQYGAFLNAKAQTDDPFSLYNPDMSSYGITRSGSSGSYTYTVNTTLANRPVVYVSWFDAARFANWLANGKDNGSTETGSYSLNGAMSGIVTANAGAQVYLPSEDEWYKAAYYNGSTSTYSLYPNGQNTITTADANYWDETGNWWDGFSTNVGHYSGDASAYGTFDQGGNVWEWNDAVVSGSSRGLRGGSWNDYDIYLESSTRYGSVPSSEYYDIGFRVASVPEPSAIVLTTLFSACLIIRRKR